MIFAARRESNITKSNCTAKEGKIIQINENNIRDHLGKIVKGAVEEILNALLDADADKLCDAGKYESTDDRKDCRAWHLFNL